jgi:hypothetical protein
MPQKAFFVLFLATMAAADAEWQSMSENEAVEIEPSLVFAVAASEPATPDDSAAWPSLQPSQPEDVSDVSIGDRTPSRPRSRNSWMSIGANDENDQQLELEDFDVADHQLVLHSSEMQDDLENARHVLALALGPQRFSSFDEDAPSGHRPEVPLGPPNVEPLVSCRMTLMHHVL